MAQSRYGTKALLLSGALGLTSLCTSAFAEQPADPTQTAQSGVIRPVKIFRLTSPGDRQVRTFQGQSQASLRTTLAFRVPGQLLEFPALEGARVKEGDLLARLDPIEYQLTKDKAEASHQLAKVEFDRSARLVEDQLISQRMHDENRTRLTRAEALLQQAEANLGYTFLRAPFDGVISRTEVENWEYVQAKDPILNVQAEGMTDVKIQIPQNVVTRLSREFVLELRALVRFSAQPSYTYFASVSEVDTEADPATLSYEVTLALPTPQDFNVTSGMTVEVDIDLAPLDPNQSDYYVLPASAVVQAEGSAPTVWKIRPETMQVHSVPVEIIGEARRGLKVKGDLSSGDMIASTGASQLSENLQVREWVRERGI